MTKEIKKVFTYKILEKIDENKENIIEKIQPLLLELYFLQKGGDPCFFKIFAENFRDHNGLAKFLKNNRLIDNDVHVLPIVPKNKRINRKDLDDNELKTMDEIEQLNRNDTWNLYNRITCNYPPVFNPLFDLSRRLILEQIRGLAHNININYINKRLKCIDICLEINRIRINNLSKVNIRLSNVNKILNKVNNKFNNNIFNNNLINNIFYYNDEARAKSYCYLIAYSIKQFWSRLIGLSHLLSNFEKHECARALLFSDYKSSRNSPQLSAATSTSAVNSDVKSRHVYEYPHKHTSEKGERFTEGNKRKRAAGLAERPDADAQAKCLKNFEDHFSVASSSYPTNICGPLNEHRSYQTINTILREYQLVGVTWLIEAHNNNINCIINDEAGLGKAVQVVTMLVNITNLTYNDPKCDPHLIIVNKAKLNKWLTLFNINNINVHVYTGTQSHIDTIFNTFNSCQFILTTYKYINKYILDQCWSVVVVDSVSTKETNIYKYKLFNSIRSKQRILIMSDDISNMCIYNLWNIFDYILSGYTDDTVLDHIFGKHDIKSILHDSKIDSSYSIKLLNVLKCFILRRDCSSVSNQLPTITESSIQCSISNRQQLLFDFYLDKLNSFSFNIPSGNTCNTIPYKDILSKSIKLFSHPSISEPRGIESPYICTPLTFHCNPNENLILERFNFNLVSSALTNNYFGFLYDDIYDPAFSFRMITRKHLGLYIKRIPKCIKWEASAHLNNEYIKNARFCRCHYDCYCKEYLKMLIESLMTKLTRIRLKKVMDRRLRRIMLGFYNSAVEHIGNPVFPPIFSNRLIHFFTFKTPKPILYKSYTNLMYKNIDNGLYKRFECITVNAVSKLTINTTPARISPKLLEQIGPKFIQFPQRDLLIKDCNKLTELDKILLNHKSKEFKILILINYIEMIDVFREYFTYRKLGYLYLTQLSSPDDKLITMEQFNRDPYIKCLIMTTMVNWSYLCMNNIDTVIIYDKDWSLERNDYIKQQIKRLSFIRNISVISLIAENSVGSLDNGITSKLVDNGISNGSINVDTGLPSIPTSSDLSNLILDEILLLKIGDKNYKYTYKNYPKEYEYLCSNAIDPRTRVNSIKMRLNKISLYAMRESLMASELSHIQISDSLVDVFEESTKHDLEILKMNENNRSEVKKYEEESEKLSESKMFLEFILKQQKNQIPYENIYDTFDDHIEIMSDFSTAKPYKAVKSINIVYQNESNESISVDSIKNYIKIKDFYENPNDRFPNNEYPLFSEHIKNESNIHISEAIFSYKSTTSLNSNDTMYSSQKNTDIRLPKFKQSTSYAYLNKTDWVSKISKGRNLNHLFIQKDSNLEFPAGQTPIKISEHIEEMKKTESTRLIERVPPNLSLDRQIGINNRIAHNQANIQLSKNVAMGNLPNALNMSYQSALASRIPANAAMNLKQQIRIGQRTDDKVSLMKEGGQPMQLRLSNIGGQQTSGLINANHLNTTLNSNLQSLNKSQIAGVNARQSLYMQTQRSQTPQLQTTQSMRMNVPNTNLIKQGQGLIKVGSQDLIQRAQNPGIAGMARQPTRPIRSRLPQTPNINPHSISNMNIQAQMNLMRQNATSQGMQNKAMPPFSRQASEMQRPTLIYNQNQQRPSGLQINPIGSAQSISNLNGNTRQNTPINTNPRPQTPQTPNPQVHPRIITTTNSQTPNVNPTPSSKSM